ncbi:MAG: hypothetical protein KBC98_02695 [Candidatus Pacebacteria bacterium]|nr:hypothetical protein [Candidatus Paceibacterota bacterium]
MKNAIILFTVLALASCEKNTPAIQQAKIVEPIKSERLSLKEKFLNGLDSNTRGFVAVIDSLKPIDFWFEKNGIDLIILPVNGKFWREVQSESSTWEEFEGGEMPDDKVEKLSRHIGHAYLLTIRKTEGWENMISKEYLDIEYNLQYGTLLETDTVGKEIFNKGTYVLSRFTKKRNVDRGEYQVEYFTNYEKFSAAIYEEVKLATKNFTWVNAAQPTGITLEL